ncbi:hypothetical protein K443DRAFT_680795 [Laccaria amethystina LaAM-08-1]|uniref:Uncharacterized protein n=1 Tax=Laccaria amethystina LaAM-08-1 TaxID=1095629 RepID=A0A0C9XAJ8_9AGAR|nr:hypothetical protein K443DRAFT_680795 [Laccaria amethystina LaAM-08-1]
MAQGLRRTECNPRRGQRNQTRGPATLPNARPDIAPNQTHPNINMGKNNQCV